MAVFDTLEHMETVENDDHYTIVEEFPEIDYTLIYRHTSFQPFVAAWGLNKEKGYWAQGHYFQSSIDAIKWICGKYRENGYEGAA